MHRPPNRGFTLIELLVVIAIIAILAAILFPVFAQARDAGRKAACQSNLKQIVTGMRLYSDDYDEAGIQYWWARGAGTQRLTWMEIVNPYVKNTAVYMCPSAPRDPLVYQPPTSCRTATAKVTAAYCLPTHFYYSFWSLNTVPMFSGFPSGVMPNSPTGATHCTNPVQVCEPSPERVASPSDAAWLVEGYVISLDPGAGSSFGDACATNYATLAQTQSIHRHNQGMNVAFCDGHVKFFTATRFWGDNTARTQSGMPKNRNMQIGL